MTTINLTNNTVTFDFNGVTYTYRTETGRYSKTENGKTTRIGKAEYEKAEQDRNAEISAKMHENLEKLNREQNGRNEFVEITEEDLRRDAEELESYIAEAEESNTDLEIAEIIKSMDEDAEDDSISAEEFIEKVQKVEKQKKVRKERKAKAAKKNAYHASAVVPGVTLTEKQVDFILHLSDSNFWENGLDSILWVDVLCDEIGGQFSGKPMTVGAMISTLCEKGLGTRSTERRGARGGKVTSFALTEMGKQVAAELGLN